MLHIIHVVASSAIFWMKYSTDVQFFAVAVEMSSTDFARNARQLEDADWPTLESNPHITDSVQATIMLQGQYNTPYQVSQAE